MYVSDDEKEEAESLFDWNPMMRDVFDGKPDRNINANIIKDLLVKHYSDLPEEKI
jgi:hypothetical protein